MRLHDEFGQILTAVGTMLQRAQKRMLQQAGAERADLREIHETVQATLEKVRSLSQALHPVVLDDAGFEGAIDAYLPRYEKQTGIAIRYEKTGAGRELAPRHRHPPLPRAAGGAQATWRGI